MRKLIAFVALVFASFGLGGAPAFAFPAPSEPGIAAEFVSALRSGNTAYAFANFNWSDGGGVYNIDLSVYDWLCDSHPTYAYFETYRAGSQTYGTTVNRVDYSGCDTGDWTSWSDLYIPDSGDTITALHLRVCIDTNNNVSSGGTGGRTGDDCTSGAWVYR